MTTNNRPNIRNQPLRNMHNRQSFINNFINDASNNNITVTEILENLILSNNIIRHNTAEDQTQNINALRQQVENLQEQINAINLNARNARPRHGQNVRTAQVAPNAQNEQIALDAPTTAPTIDEPEFDYVDNHPISQTPWPQHQHLPQPHPQPQPQPQPHPPPPPPPPPIVATILTHCCICLSEQANFANINCGHCCCCINCVDRLHNQCPICRTYGRFIRIIHS